MHAIMFLYNSICFINHIINPNYNIDFNLISGFLSAIDSFASSVEKQDLHSIELGKNKIIYSKINFSYREKSNEVVTIIIFIDKTTNEQKVQKLIDQLKKAFFDIYTPEDLVEWDGNILKFYPFKGIIDKIIKEGDKFQNHFIAQELNNLKQSIPEIDNISFIISDMNLNPLKIYCNNNEQIIKNIFSKIEADVKYYFEVNKNIQIYKVYIPLLEQNEIVFAYIRKISFQDQWILLIFLFFIPDNLQLFLSHAIQNFDEKINNIIQNITSISLENLDQCYEIIGAKLKNINILKDTIKNKEFFPRDYNYIIGKDFNDFDKIIYSIIIGEPIVITGPLEEVKKFAHQIQIFAPHRCLRIYEFPTTPLQKNQFDIVEIEEKDLKYYKDFVIVDLKKRNVKNGKSNKFCKEILNKIQKYKDPILISKIIKRDINYLLSKASLILNLSWGSKIEPNEIKNIRTDLSPDAEDLVLNLISGKGNRIQNLIDKLSSQIPVSKLILDENFVKFNDIKVIISSKLTKEQIETYQNKLIELAKLFIGERFVQEIVKQI